MKFWKNLLEEIGAITHWIIKAGAELLEPLKSIDKKLTKEFNHIPNIEPIKKVSNVPILLLLENNNRHNLIIQNIGVNPCFIKLGEGISLNDFHFVLAPDTYPSFGNGGSIELKDWHGEVYAICEKETKISVLEY